MSRKSETFFDAITHLREDLIEEAQNHKFRKETAAWKKFGSLAACVVLIMSVGVLAILPRGCGSSGGTGSNSSPASQGAPASGDTAPPLYGSGNNGGLEESLNGDDPGDGAPSGGSELYQFTAIVMEVRDEAVLVKPIEYDSDDQYLIPLAPEYPALSEGDRISVTCTRSLILTANPPILPNVRSIEKIDPAE